MPGRVPPVSGVLYAASLVWEAAKAAAPTSCLGAADEKLNFAKTGREKGDMEMTSVGGAAPGEEGGPPGEGAPPLQREASVASTSTVGGGEGGDHDAITEWQAGWNVTNAIQVVPRPRILPPAPHPDDPTHPTSPLYGLPLTVTLSHPALPLPPPCRPFPHPAPFLPP